MKEQVFFTGRVVDDIPAMVGDTPGKGFVDICEDTAENIFPEIRMTGERLPAYSVMQSALKRGQMVVVATKTFDDYKCCFIFGSDDL